MLAVETWLIEVSSLNASLHRFTGKWKYQQIIYTSLLKLQFKAVISAKHVLITNTFVPYLPLIKI